MGPLHTALASLALTALCGAQTTWYADASATPPGDGSLASPYASLQAAIAAPTTMDGDTVSVAPGTYLEHLDFLGKAIRVVSQQGPAVTVVDGGGTDSVVRFASGETAASVLEGLRITNGFGETPSGEPPTGAWSGGGVFIDGSSPTLLGCEIAGNGSNAKSGPATSSGGGIYIRDGSPRVEQCSITDNEAVNHGGGIDVRGASSPLVVDSLIAFNSTGYNGSRGGGIHVQVLGAPTPPLVRHSTIQANDAISGGGTYGPLEVRDSEILDNVATTGGGAHGAALLLRCTLRGNVAGQHPAFPLQCGSGGGAYDSDLVECTVELNSSCTGGGIDRGSAVDTTFVGNSAVFLADGLGSAWGGGASSASLLRCTLVDNWTEAWPVPELPERNQGGGLSGCTAERCDLRGNLSDRGGAAAGSTLIHCSVSDNDARDDTGGVLGGSTSNSIVWGNANGDADATAAFSYSVIAGDAPGTGNLDLDPRFWNPAAGDLRLMVSSPAIDAGNPASPLDPDGSQADMGAYPYDPTHAPGTARFCFGSAASCPCGNGGSGDGGCDLAQGTGGVELSVLDFAPDGAGGGSVALASTGYPPAASPAVIVIRSPQAQVPPVVFGDGLRCIATTGLVRLGSTLASGGTALQPVGHGAGAGTFRYQVWVRNNPSAFCTPAAFNLSNGVSISWP